MGCTEVLSDKKMTTVLALVAILLGFLRVSDFPNSYVHCSCKMKMSFCRLLNAVIDEITVLLAVDYRETNQ